MIYTFLVPESKPLAETTEMLEWAKVYCPSYITNIAKQIEDEWYYVFHFSQKKDYVWFKLRWS